MRAITAVLLGMMWLSPPLSAADDGAPAIADIPFDFIPGEFHGKWVLTRFQHLEKAPVPPEDPDYFIGKHVEIGNNWINLFGRVCEIYNFRLRFSKADPRHDDFDEFQIPDAELKQKLSYSRDLTVYCELPVKLRPRGPRAPLLSHRGGAGDSYFRLYDRSSDFLILGMSRGWKFLLRPADGPRSRVPQRKPAADDWGPATADVPFEFIPGEFHGKWVLTDYQYPPIGPPEPTDPDYFIGRRVEIGNNWVNIFGHVCETTRLDLSYREADPRFDDFDKLQIPDADIKEQYPYSRDLTITCVSSPDPPPVGPEAAFLGFDGGAQHIFFNLYSPSNDFITLGMSNGPEFILRPIGWPQSQALDDEQVD